MDQEVYRLISTAYKKALDILKENRKYLDVMAKALLQYETISGEEVDMIISGADLDTLEKKRQEHNVALELERKESSKKMKEKQNKEKDNIDKLSSVEPVGEPEPVF